MARRGDPRDPYSYVHPRTTVDGDVRAERLRVDGRLRGAVTVDGLLEIAPGGRVEGGPVRARDVRVAGDLIADVRAEGTVEIWRGGTLQGDVRAGALDVDEGGRFLGRSLPADAPDPPDAAPASAADATVAYGEDLLADPSAGVRATPIEGRAGRLAPAARDGDDPSS